jgi:hypothetical protein
MSGYLWRVIIAAFACLLVFALMPPFFHLIGFSPNEDLMTIVRICTAALAILYVLFGSAPPWPPKA